MTNPPTSLLGTRSSGGAPPALKFSRRGVCPRGRTFIASALISDNRHHSQSLLDPSFNLSSNRLVKSG